MIGWRNSSCARFFVVLHCYYLLRAPICWPRRGSSRGKPPLVDEFCACSAHPNFHRRCYTEKPDLKASRICFVYCIKLWSLIYIVFFVYLVSHVLLFLYSRRSSRRVLRICGTAGNHFVCWSLSPQCTLQKEYVATSNYSVSGSFRRSSEQFVTSGVWSKTTERVVRLVGSVVEHLDSSFNWHHIGRHFSPHTPLPFM